MPCLFSLDFRQYPFWLTALAFSHTSYTHHASRWLNLFVWFCMCIYIYNHLHIICISTHSDSIFLHMYQSLGWSARQCCTFRCFGAGSYGFVGWDPGALWRWIPGGNESWFRLADSCAAPGFDHRCPGMEELWLQWLFLLLLLLLLIIYYYYYYC